MNRIAHTPWHAIAVQWDFVLDMKVPYQQQYDNYDFVLSPVNK